MPTFINLLIDNKYYKKNQFIRDLIFDKIELYILKKYKTTKFKHEIVRFYYNLVRKIHNFDKFNLDEESLLLECKSKLFNE